MYIELAIFALFPGRGECVCNVQDKSRVKRC